MPQQRNTGQLRLDTFGNILRLLPKGRLLDLGTGQGKFAAIALALGWDVTAVDARADVMPMSAGIRWVHGDAREFDVSGYDCIAILGLLYHLEDPRSFLDRCAGTGTVTIIDTHAAQRAEVNHLGYDGSFYFENTKISTASWINERSFWPTKSELIRMLHDAGYETVMEVEPPHAELRTFYLCCPPKP